MEDQEISDFIKNEVSSSIGNLKTEILLQTNLTKAAKIWLLIQKHAFMIIIYITIGALFGIVGTKTVYKNYIRDGINMGRVLFEEEIYDIQPSAVQKVYDKKKAEQTSQTVIPVKK